MINTLADDGWLGLSLKFLCIIYIHLYSPKTVEICELYSYTKINNMLLYIFVS